MEERIKGKVSPKGRVIGVSQLPWKTAADKEFPRRFEYNIPVSGWRKSLISDLYFAWRNIGRNDKHWVHTITIIKQYCFIDRLKNKRIWKRTQKK